MSNIGPNGYNFDYIVPTIHYGHVNYIYNPNIISPTGYIGVNNEWTILYGNIAGCYQPGLSGDIQRHIRGTCDIQRQ
jgi:hypothetical protein